MMAWLQKIFGPSGSSATAKERLRLVLLTDHLSLAPDVVEALKRDLLAVISRYVEVDESHADVSFERQDSAVAMLANIPIVKMRDRPLPPDGGPGRGSHTKVMPVESQLPATSVAEMATIAATPSATLASAGSDAGPPAVEDVAAPVADAPVTNEGDDAAVAPRPVARRRRRRRRRPDDPGGNAAHQAVG